MKVNLTNVYRFLFKWKNNDYAPETIESAVNQNRVDIQRKIKSLT